MEFVNKVELRRLLDYAMRVESRIDMPSRSELGTWLQRLYTAAGDDAVASFRANLDESQLPWSAVRPNRRGALVTPPPTLALVLGGAVDDDGSEVSSELLDALERWDTQALGRLL